MTCGVPECLCESKPTVSDLSWSGSLILTGRSMYEHNAPRSTATTPDSAQRSGNAAQPRGMPVAGNQWSDLAAPALPMRADGRLCGDLWAGRSAACRLDCFAAQGNPGAGRENLRFEIVLF